MGLFLNKVYLLILVMSLSVPGCSSSHSIMMDAPSYKKTSTDFSNKKSEIKKDLEQAYGKELTSIYSGTVRSFETKAGIHVDYGIVEDVPPESYRTYKVGPGDSLELLLERIGLDEEYQSYEITSDYIEKIGEMVFTKYKVTVGPAGNVNIPLVGEANVAYRSIKEVEEYLKGKLRKYLVNPKVFVKIASYASYSISVVGEVNRPGIYEIKRPICLSEALALGGGITHDGSWTRIYIGRHGERSKRLNITEIWIRGGIGQEIVLERDDIVLVPPKLWMTYDRAEQLAAIILMLSDIYNGVNPQNG